VFPKNNCEAFLLSSSCKTEYVHTAYYFPYPWLYWSLNTSFKNHTTWHVFFQVETHFLCGTRAICKFELLQAPQLCEATKALAWYEWTTWIMKILQNIIDKEKDRSSINPPFKYNFIHSVIKRHFSWMPVQSRFLKAVMPQKFFYFYFSQAFRILVPYYRFLNATHWQFTWTIFCINFGIRIV
jgi:hypothetical protein